MQRKQRFTADQRFDLPQYESLIGYIDAEFNTYNKAFLAPLNYIVKNWQIVNNGGLSVKVSQTTDSLLFNSERVGVEAMNYRQAAEAALSITLTDNATNYVELRLVTQTCAPDTVALWDSTANGGTGEEYTQTVDTAYEEAPYLVANTTIFSGDTDKLPLAVVVTSGGVITSITDARQMLHHLTTDWNFGVTRTDIGIGSYKDAFDALATSFKEMKGTANWYDVPYAGNKLLKEYQNMFITGGGNILWEGSNPASTLSWSGTLQIEIADRINIYTVNPASILLGEGQAIYVDIPEGAPPGALTPIVADLKDVPIDSSSVGYSPGIQVLFFRRNGEITGWMDIPELSSGETAVIGQDLPTLHRQRLGIIDDSNFVAYTSAVNYLPTDSHPIAISKLDAALSAVSLLSSANDSAIDALFLAVGAIMSGDPIEEHLVVGSGGVTLFNASVLRWNPESSSVDITVYVNGQKITQDPDGLLNLSYRKNSSQQLEFSDTIPEFARITVRNAVPYLYRPYFVNYLTGASGVTVSVGGVYSVGNDRLGVYRNGLYLMRSPSLGDTIDRYIEQSGVAAELGLASIPADVYAFVNQAAAPAFKQFQTGVTGTVLTVPAYVMASNRLRVYRNGLMLNKSAYGAPVDQYVETSTTSITVPVAAAIADYFVYEEMALPPAWRQDITGVSGVTLTFASAYMIGNKRLLVWKNGILMFNSTTIGTAGDRYQETTTLTITMGVAAVAGDVFTAIYQ